MHLSLLEPVDFDGFLENLQTDLADILRVDTLVLVMETATKEGAPELGGPLTMAPVGTVARAIAGGRRGQPSGEVILRRVAHATAGLHGTPVASEALIPLDLGPNRMPALLLMHLAFDYVGLPRYPGQPNMVVLSVIRVRTNKKAAE